MSDVVSGSHASLAYHGRSFHLASRLLPAASRDDAAICYAFCRLADDTVDEATDADAARLALSDLRAEVRGDKPARPLVAAWRALVNRRGIPACAADGLLDGMESDLGIVRVADEPELLRYCYRAAGTVGLMMSAILGATGASASAHAIDLGVAMQLTNIARDVAEDAGRGRVYLPADRLALVGTGPIRTTSGGVVLDPAATRVVVAEVLGLAERFYASGLAGVRFLPARVRPAIFAAAFLYRGIGRRLLAQGGDPLRGRVVLSGWERGKLALAGLLASLRPLPRLDHDPHLHLPLHGLLPDFSCPTV